MDRIEKRLATWKRNFLSKGGRLVLIKAVISSIPNYFFSAFNMPVGIAQRIERLQRNFLWGDGAIKRKMHAVKWDEVCMSKASGGLGIVKILLKNKAMLIKWLWRFGREENALWRHVICSKYKIRDNSMSWNWSRSISDSYFVKAIASLLKSGSQTANSVKEGFVSIVGRGDRVEFWSEVCVQGVSLKEAFPRCFALASKKSGVVKDFGGWSGSVWAWKVD